jgi:hypothetical protein
VEQALIDWLGSTNLSEAIVTSSWTWPIAEVFHFAGMTLLVGAIGVLDLRMMGMAKQLPVAPLHRFVPLGIAGFVINLITGVIFLIGASENYIGNTAFYLKMLFVVLAGVNVGLFYLTGVYRKVEALGPGEDAPVGAVIIGASSLIFWTLVIYFGRHLPYL